MRSIGLRLQEASCGELAEAAHSIAAELALRPTPESGLAGLELAETLGRTADLVEAALAAAVGRVDATGAHGELGFPSVVSWLRERLGMRHGRAAERVTLARQLPRLGRVAKLLTGGRLSAGFASAICAAVPRLGEADAEVAEDILLGMVDDGCDVRQVGRAADRITDLIAEREGRDPEPADSRRGFARSWLQKAKSLDGGLWIKGWFNPEHSAAFDQIVGPLAKPKARFDDRDLSQRTADAMFAVLTEGNRGAGVTLVIDLAAFTTVTGDDGCFTYGSRNGAGTSWEETPGSDQGNSEGAAAGKAASGPGRGPGYARDCGCASPGAEGAAAGEAGPAPGFGQGPGCVRDSGCAPFESETGAAGESARGSGRRRLPARFLDGTPIAPDDARRIALNAGISPLVLGRKEIPLYLGRRVRFATSAQRKVLLASYDTCCVRGCQIPAHLSEVHHLGGGWKLGSPTDIDQLTMLCGWHNRWIETHRHQVTQSRDVQGRTVFTILPPWSSPRAGAARPSRGPGIGSRRSGAP